MQTYTTTLSSSFPPLTGEAHVTHVSLPPRFGEFTVNNLGPRIIALIGNSRKRTALIITPGGDLTISEEDRERMELAIREPLMHMDMLFGHKGTIPLFRAVRERVSESIGVRHTPALLDAERRLDLLSQIHGLNLYSNPLLSERAGELGAIITHENKKSIHIWDEMTTQLLRTDTGRKIFRQLRPIYLERQKKKEEAELAEFRSLDSLFRSLIEKLKPTKIFIGTPEQTGRLEIYARHLSKLAGDTHQRLSRPIENVDAQGVNIDLSTYSQNRYEFEV